MLWIRINILPFAQETHNVHTYIHHLNQHIALRPRPSDRKRNRPAILPASYPCRQPKDGSLCYC